MSSVAKGREGESLRSVAESFNATLPPAQHKRVMAALRQVQLELERGPEGQWILKRDTNRGKLCTLVIDPARIERAAEDSVAFGKAILDEMNPLADSFISAESAKINLDALSEDAKGELLGPHTSLYCSEPLPGQVLSLIEGKEWATAKSTLLAAIDTILGMNEQSEKTDTQD
jgi:hypothetical protein